MILRRLTKHMEDQNWFAVGLDFCIVVLGILIAFQITNWSAARQDNLIYEQARARVIEEANTNLVLSQNAIRRVVDQKNQAFEILRDFETCSAENGAEGRFMRAMQTLRLIVGLNVRRDAINQILTSDAFLDNISPEDRTTLSAYLRRVDNVADNSRFSDSFYGNRPPPQDNPIFQRTLDGDFSGGLAKITLTVSYEEACQDTALNQFLFDRLENGAYITSLASSLAEASREVLIELGESPPETPEAEPAP
ncbi:MAG: hypothetical protein VR74_00560 [Hyphomonas sp. BRH_c22]|uniref:hypothetical protein n=1 Tax=Hyphomonas sp. BRH_c22 TaxID=1629710 RepID=UPI0005F19608|nr:hypothetical protein [Hyphomonas sp. BRH_c22]KJS39716.1 MAG: hypothetical protein VR74_00560 [Hyphomonas sp. BRH_c22]